jgi:DNA-binding MarR family transcriptional regulator
VQDEISRLMADVYEAAGAFRSTGQKIAAIEGQTLAQWHLLDALGDPSATVARAARRLGLSRQAVQKTANDLEAAGLLEFRENPDHKSSPLIVVTPRGDEVRERLAAHATTSHHARFADLTPEQLAVTSETLRRMTQSSYEALP